MWLSFSDDQSLVRPRGAIYTFRYFSKRGIVKIAILRHGKPEQITEQAINASAFAGWITQYNKSGIVTSSPPTEQCRVYANSCNAIVSSSLPRSEQSARCLLSQQPLVSDPIFVEAGMPHADWTNLNLSPKYWAALFRVMWFAGYSKHSESHTDARQRAQLAVKKLVELAIEYESVLFVGHGIFNRMISAELRTLGWVGPRNPGTKYWAFSVYSK